MSEKIARMSEKAEMFQKKPALSSHGLRVLAHRVLQIADGTWRRHVLMPYITTVASSPDGKLVASTSKDMTIFLWDAATGDRLRELQGPTDWGSVLAFSPNSKIVASAWKNTVSLWDVATGEILRILESGGGIVTCLAFSPDGKIVSSASRDMILLWDAATGEKLHTLRGPRDRISGLTFSPDGKMVASAWEDVINLWDTATGNKLRIFEDHSDIVTGFAFSPDSKIVASALPNMTLLWDAATGEKLLESEGASYWRFGLAFSPDGKIFASVSKDMILLWDVATKEKLRIFEDHQNMVTGLTFSPDGKIVASASKDMILLWDAVTGEKLLRLEGRWDSATGPAFSPDGKMVVSISEDAVNLWDVEVDSADTKAEDEGGSTSRLQGSPSKSNLVSETGIPPTIPTTSTIPPQNLAPTVSTPSAIPTTPTTPETPTILTAPAPAPYPPEEEEQIFYYHGLPSRPRLVARSSGFRWQRRFSDQHEMRKVLRNVGNHPIVDQYNDNDNVVKDIINVLRDLQWNAIDVLRIGYEFEEPTKYPVVLWVSVKPGSTTWDKGCQCAINCKAVLRKYNIPDIECEIRESEVFDLAGPKLLKPQLQDYCSNLRLPFTRTLGQSIAPSYLEREGSMGLYLKQSDGKYFGLTCRHNVLDKDKDNEAYSYTNRSQPAKMIIQPGPLNLKKQDRTCDSLLNFWSAQRKHDESTAEKEIQELNETKEILNRFRNSDGRLIGHLRFSPPRALHHSNGCLMDWALIELDVEKFGEDLTNTVYIGDVPILIMQEIANYRPYDYFKMGRNKSLKLEGCIPLDDMKHPKMTDMDDEPCLLVAKRGPITELTWGRANEVKSVTRSDPDVASIEWCMIGLPTSQPFSKRGDSGSIVFDLKGRIGGIMTAGTGLTESTDVTYAIPMEWLLSDIKEKLKIPIHIC